MGVKRYKIPLKAVPRQDDPEVDFYAPDIAEGVEYVARCFCIQEMTCKIEVDENEVISNGDEIDYDEWQSLEIE